MTRLLLTVMGSYQILVNSKSGGGSKMTQKRPVSHNWCFSQLRWLFFFCIKSDKTISSRWAETLHRTPTTMCGDRNKSSVRTLKVFPWIWMLLTIHLTWLMYSVVEPRAGRSCRRIFNYPVWAIIDLVYLGLLIQLDPSRGLIVTQSPPTSQS